MKVYLSTMFFLILICFSGCIEVVDEGKVLSFWTDQESQDSTLALLINDEYLDDLHRFIDYPNCIDSLLTNYAMQGPEDLFISVVENADTIEIGMVNLYSVSTGIKIKPSERGDIFVDQPLDAECTLIRLNWE